MERLPTVFGLYEGVSHFIQGLTPPFPPALGHWRCSFKLSSLYVVELKRRANGEGLQRLTAAVVCVFRSISADSYHHHYHHQQQTNRQASSDVSSLPMTTTNYPTSFSSLMTSNNRRSSLPLPPAAAAAAAAVKPAVQHNAKVCSFHVPTVLYKVST